MYRVVEFYCATIQYAAGRNYQPMMKYARADGHSALREDQGSLCFWPPCPTSSRGTVNPQMTRRPPVAQIKYLGSTPI